MATMNGPPIMMTEGSDFLHRQRLARQYQISARTKWRLKFCVTLHFLLFVIMMLKLSADILDKLDIFILELEELEIPPPVKWEYVWSFSVLYSLCALFACRKNSVFYLQIYIGGIVTLGLAPALGALCYYLPDAYRLITAETPEEAADVPMWQGHPYSIINLAFLLPVLQVHGFALFFSSRLVSGWKARSSKKTQ